MEIQLRQVQRAAERAFPRIIRLKELRQNLVYENLLEGVPTHETNAAILERIPAEIRQTFLWIPSPPYLITPLETPIEWEKRKPYFLGTPASLPSVKCISRWDSFENEADFDTSTLIIVWFQNEFARPIDPEIAEVIANVDWEILTN